jgi:hypothetical protein
MNIFNVFCLTTQETKYYSSQVDKYYLLFAEAALSETYVVFAQK